MKEIIDLLWKDPQSIISDSDREKILLETSERKESLKAIYDLILTIIQSKKEQFISNLTIEQNQKMIYVDLMIKIYSKMLENKTSNEDKFNKIMEKYQQLYLNNLIKYENYVTDLNHSNKNQSSQSDYLLDTLWELFIIKNQLHNSSSE